MANQKLPYLDANATAADISQWVADRSKEPDAPPPFRFDSTPMDVLVKRFTAKMSHDLTDMFHQFVHCLQLYSLMHLVLVVYLMTSIESNLLWSIC